MLKQKRTFVELFISVCIIAIVILCVVFARRLNNERMQIEYDLEKCQQDISNLERSVNDEFDIVEGDLAAISGADNELKNRMDQINNEMESLSDQLNDIKVLEDENTVDHVTEDNLEEVDREATSESDEIPKHLYSNCKITHYCPCDTCCGKSDGITASGVPAQVGRTVACGGLPFGTKLLINGQRYVVEDTGVGEFEIDIFVGDHQEALNKGVYYADVYIIDE